MAGNCLNKRFASRGRSAGNARHVLLAVYENNSKKRSLFMRSAGFTGDIGNTMFMVGDVPFRDMVYARAYLNLRRGKRGCEAVREWRAAPKGQTVGTAKGAAVTG